MRGWLLFSSVRGTFTIEVAMKVAIVGSRYFTNYEMFVFIVSTFRSRYKFDMIISGGAAGVDTLAYQYSVKHGITFVCHPPIPSEGFPRAFFRRNLRIVEMSELVIALPMGKSSGTRHSISLAKRLGKKLEIVELKGE